MDIFRFLLFIIFVLNISCEDEKESSRLVPLEEGDVIGKKYWNGDYYEFYGVPYATAPTGRDRFKAPLPVKKREHVLEASKQTIMCQQSFYTEDDEEEVFLHGEEDCLVMNILVPKLASKTNLLPVIVYIHSGAFSGGSANMGKLHYVVNRDVIAISFNYRVGGLGFACLGTEDIPGNAGLKDQLAALKWINKNIKRFGGDPERVTLAGFSVGAAMAELHVLSKQSKGLFHQLILESGSALAPFAINRDPIFTAKNIAMSMGYNGTDVKDLNEFYLEVSINALAIQSVNFFLPNSTFGFSPCLESIEHNPQPFLTESPLETIMKGDYKKVPILTGFSNMEGLSRVIKFENWYSDMNKNFAKFIPADLTFSNDATKENMVKEIREYYFKKEEITHISKQEYVDYFSDSMFKYPIMKSLKLHAERADSIYFYEFSYTGQLNMKHYFMDTIKGASHRDQTAYIWDLLTYTSAPRDMDTRDRMTYMWTDFVKYGNPTAFESDLIQTKWLKYSNKNPNYLSIGDSLEMKKGLFEDSYKFWNNIYEKYYWNPVSVSKSTN